MMGEIFCIMLQCILVNCTSVWLHLGTSLHNINWVPAALEHISCWIPPDEALDTALVHHEGMEVYSLSFPCSWHSCY
jgi:hypothetical protein